MSTKERILAAAKELFAKQSFESVSMRDIAKKSGAAVSAINYHYESKDKLFLTLVDSFTSEKIEGTLEVLTSPKNKVDFQIRLEMFAETFISALLKDLPLYQLIQKELDKRNPIIQPVVDGTLRAWFEGLTAFFTQARKKEILSKSISPEFLAMIFLREISQTVRNDDWQIWFNKKSLTDAKHRKSWIQALIQILMCGAFSEEVRK